MANDGAREVIAENCRLFNGLLDEAARDVEASRLRSAAVTLQTAARFASSNHPGFYRSPRLESIALDIGERMPSSRATGIGPRVNVLHVLTQALTSGGHTRLVWRWIESDESRVHSVVLTGQSGGPIPSELRDAVEKSGGQIIRIHPSRGNLLKRAQQLRDLVAERSDLVVLHIHPYDVVPLIACVANPTPVVFLNHADHVFWIGAAVTDVLADIRPAGHALSLSQRGFSDRDSAILPVPLRKRPQGNREASRRSLHLTDDSVLVLSIASSYKYDSPPNRHFIDVHRDFVLRHPNVNLIVVGPDDSGRWREINLETGGRFRAVGTVRDLDVYYDAADIYVDSLPFGSLTSLIDAGVCGLPVLGLNESAAHSVLTSDDISLAAASVQFSSRDAYVQELVALTTQPQYRRDMAAATRDALSRDHLTPGWNLHLEKLYGILKKRPPLHRLDGSEPHVTTEQQGEVELALLGIHVAPGFSVPLWKCQVQDAQFRGAQERLRVALAAPPGERAKSLRFLFPNALGKWRRLKPMLRRMFR